MEPMDICVVVFFALLGLAPGIALAIHACCKQVEYNECDYYTPPSEEELDLEFYNRNYDYIINLGKDKYTGCMQFHKLTNFGYKPVAKESDIIDHLDATYYEWMPENVFRYLEKRDYEKQKSYALIMSDGFETHEPE